MNRIGPGGRREVGGGKRDARQSPGFTLLEVLLAMAILSVVMTVIYTSFSTAGNNVRQAESIREETDIARALINRISADIANAYLKTANVPTVFYGAKEEIDGSNGERLRHDSISMTTLTNWRRIDSQEMELWEVGYFFKERPDGKGYALFRREKRELSKDSPPLEGGVEYELTDRVASLQFRYSGSGTTWADEGWDRKTQAPKAVEIIIMLDTGRVYATKVDVGNS